MDDSRTSAASSSQTTGRPIDRHCIQIISMLSIRLNISFGKYFCCGNGIESNTRTIQVRIFLFGDDKYIVDLDAVGGYFLVVFVRVEFLFEAFGELINT